MFQESITQIEENVLRHKFPDQNTILHEYENVVASLKNELSNCKLEQNKLRLEIQTLQKENQHANETIRRSLTECHHDKCNDVVHNKEAFTNLEKQITILQMEKDSIYQLWQMSLKAIDVLEEELKTVHKEDKSTKFYQDNINNIKEAYSEAIKALESKLIAAKENFFQQQTLWEKRKEKIDELTKEKRDIAEQLHTIQQQVLEKEKCHEIAINSLKDNLNRAEAEREQIKKSKISLENSLKDAQKFASTLLSKDYEAKSKVSEAIDLVESAVKEKEAILKKEAQTLEEKRKLETCLAKLSEEYTSRLEQEVTKAKETYSKNVKKYLLEIKELKAELREQGTLLDRSQREYRLVEEELEKIKKDSEDFVQKSTMKIASLEHTLHEKDFKFRVNDESHKSIYDDRIQYLEQKIYSLQEKLTDTSEKLRRAQLQNSRDVEDHVREADDRTREIMEKCSQFERQLSRTLIDKEKLVSNLHTLELSFEREMQKRNHEKMFLETKVRDLQEKIFNSNSMINNSTTSVDNLSNKRNTEQQTLLNADSITNILALQEKYDRKTKELTLHVETHQKLTNKWKEEANLLTSKFQKRTQDLKSKIVALQRQNEELSRELLFYQQLLARCNTQFVQNINRDPETR